MDTLLHTLLVGAAAAAVLGLVVQMVGTLGVAALALATGVREQLSEQTKPRTGA